MNSIEPPKKVTQEIGRLKREKLLFVRDGLDVIANAVTDDIRQYKAKYFREEARRVAQVVPHNGTEDE